MRVTQKNEASEAPAGAGASLSVLATRPTGPASRVRSAGLRPPLTPAPHATIDPQKAEESPDNAHFENRSNVRNRRLEDASVG